jgi:hypothetical protein
MTPLQMIAEWRKGCTCASKESPEECPLCTRGLIDAMERALLIAPYGAKLHENLVSTTAREVEPSWHTLVRGDGIPKIALSGADTVYGEMPAEHAPTGQPTYPSEVHKWFEGTWDCDCNLRQVDSEGGHCD